MVENSLKIKNIGIDDHFVDHGYKEKIHGKGVESFLENRFIIFPMINSHTALSASFAK